jgi:hypothetical protein
MRRAGITALDCAILIAASIALVVLLGARGRIHLAGWTISVRSSANLWWLTAAKLALRAGLGWGVRPFPSVDRLLPLLDAERERLLAPMPWDRRAWRYACLAAAGGTIWILPQILHLRWVPDAGDPIFSAWRVAAVAHQLATDPRHLWNGNIFYPLPYTITYSDSLFLQAILGAPFLLAGVDPLIVVNVLMALTYPARALAFFAAARRLTGDPQAALVAALAGAWSPFYPDHYSQLELQSSLFVPLAVVGLMRLLAAPRWRTGVLFGTAVALQCLACMHLAVMMLLFLLPLGVVLMIAWRVRPSRQLAAGAIGAALVLGPVAGALSQAYLAGRDAHGDRSIQEVSEGSAFPHEYRNAPNRLVHYRWQSRDGHRPERELYPGTAPLLLAGAAIVPPLTPVAVATVAASALAFDLSLGLKGLVYDDFYKWFAAIRGMRVVARFTSMVQTGLTFLVALGAARILRRAGSPGRRAAVCAALALLVVIDLRAEVALQPYPAGIPPIYRDVNASMVLAEFPDGHVVDTMYYSTRHWAKLLDGYSGFFPDAPGLTAAKQTFPAPEAVATLRALGATHLSYTCAWESNSERCARTLDALEANPSIAVVARGAWQGKPVVLYRFR